MNTMETYLARIQQIHSDLGIPQNYAQLRGLDVQIEATTLDVVETDTTTGKQHRLIPAAIAAWQQMKQAAQSENILIQVGSAFRSVDYQVQLIQGKLAKGQLLSDILKTLAAPGFSEHHTGRAIDITSPDAVAFSTAFATTPAYAWLQKHAEKFGFKLSFPENNKYGFIFEPWHWCFGG